MKDKLMDKLYQLTQIHMDEILNHRRYFEEKSLNRQRRSRRRNGGQPNVSPLYHKCIDELVKLYDEGDSDVFLFKQSVVRTNSYRYGTGERSNLPLQYMYEVNFPSLYPTIMLKLYDEGIMKFNNRPFGVVVTELIRHKVDIKERFTGPPSEDSFEDYFVDKIINDNVWYLVKILINWTHTILGIGSKYQVTHWGMISQYTKGQFDMLIDMLPDFIHEIDVDVIRFTHYDTEHVSKIIHHVLDKTGLPYEVTKEK